MLLFYWIRLQEGFMWKIPRVFFTFIYKISEIPGNSWAGIKFYRKVNSGEILISRSPIVQERSLPFLNSLKNNFYTMEMKKKLA